MVSGPEIASVDALIPFMIHDAPVRGRVVRLRHSVSAIIERHQYPDVVSGVLAEVLVVVSMMASNLKDDGVFTLQVQSDGPISLLVVDATHHGHLRGYAQFDEAKLAELTGHDLKSLFGSGYLAITLDQGDASQRYQGVVPLEGNSIAEAIEYYFIHSYQLDVRIHVAAGKQHNAGEAAHWVAGGIYVERMPDVLHPDDDVWDRSRALFATVSDAELLDETLQPDVLLHRLFHEDGVWVYPPHVLFDQCRCSREKIVNTLSQMGDEALDEMQQNGGIQVDCQFCDAHYEFTVDEIKRTDRN